MSLLCRCKMTESVTVQITLLILFVSFNTLKAVPVETFTEAPLSASTENVTKVASILNNTTEATSPATSPPTPAQAPPAKVNKEVPAAAEAPQTDLETAASEQKGTSVVVSPHEQESAVGGDYDPAAASSMYANYLTPDALHQYINQFGAAYPGYAAYPAPLGYAAPLPPPPAPIYPGPYVQTGYEGYLVPATAGQTTTNASGDISTTTTTTTGVTHHSNTSLLNPFAFLSNIFPALMMSTVFRVLASVLAAIAMIFFGNALARAICDFTPICDASMKTVAYLRSDKGATRVGRMIAEGITPERVRRTTEFVREAIRKYHELQQLVDDDEQA